MRFGLGLTMILCLVLAGCGDQGTATSTTTAGNGTAGTSPAGTSGDSSAASSATTASASPMPVPIESGVATLSPENTKIQFVGTHAPPKPKDPRTGGFTKFTGKAEIDADTKMLKSVSAEIDTTSIWTQFEKLTGHLNSEDFFDTRTYPTAKFESTNIEPAAEESEYTVTGNLTLLKTTKEITFPATVSVGENGLMLTAKFTIDRTEFGMDRLQDQVETPVELTIVIGEKTQPLSAAGPPGGGRTPGRTNRT